MKMSIKIDPNGKFLDVEPQRLYMACGILPIWAISPEFVDVPVMEAFTIQYRFPMMPMSGCKINDIGEMRYPQDPVQHPYCRIKRMGETIYLYAYSVVGIVDKHGNVTVVRMD